MFAKANQALRTYCDFCSMTVCKNCACKHFPFPVRHIKQKKENLRASEINKRAASYDIISKNWVTSNLDTKEDEKEDDDNDEEDDSTQ